MLRPSAFSVALCVALLGFAFASQAAAAATIQVTTTTDENGTNPSACSLREAIRSANGNTPVGGCVANGTFGDDTITVPAGLYLLTVTSGTASGDLDLTTNITINGAGRTQTVVDATSLNDRVFDVSDATAVVTITGLTVQHGHAAGNGGGIRNQGTLTLRDVLVFENTADDDGGGVYNDDDRTLTLVRTSIRDNTAGQDGGGLFNDEGGTVRMTDGDISGNDAVEDAGGLRNEPNGTVNLTRVTIDGNETQQDAGGVRNDGTMTMDRVTVSRNIAADTSGGIENRGDLDIADSTIERNEAGDDGGGIQNSSGADLTIVRSAIVRNTTGEDGGGIDADGGTVNLTNVTISGNEAAVDGGGLEGSDGATITLLHVTIANNTAGGLGDGIFNDPSPPATITLRGTIIANNSAGPNCAGDPVTSNGFNLEFPNNSCNLGAPGDRPNADPRLGALANDGGYSPTHALLPGSAAIDTATNAGCPSSDQRVEPRPADGDANGSAICDIGAYEVQPRRTAEVRNDPNNDDEEDEKPKETEQQRQQRERTNASNRGEYKTEGNVLAVERAPDGKTLLVTIGLVKKETLIVQVTCVDLKCPDVRVGDYLEADGYQNGVGDPNAYFIAEDVTILRNGKKVK